jgi:hypothetical protein
MDPTNRSIPQTKAHTMLQSLHHPLEVCIRKNIYTQEWGVGLG